MEHAYKLDLILLSATHTTGVLDTKTTITSK